MKTPFWLSGERGQSPPDDISACSGEVATGSLAALRASQRADQNTRVSCDF
jgi:hypothetical protein